MWFAVTDSESQFIRIITSHKHFIETTFRTSCKRGNLLVGMREVVIQDKCPVKNCNLSLTNIRCFSEGEGGEHIASVKTPFLTAASMAGAGEKGGPTCLCVNVVLDNTPRHCASNCNATLLLENSASYLVAISAAHL